MDYSRLKNPEKAIFAVREVVCGLPIYQTRGMACAVDVGGKQCLLTWEGVFKEDDLALIESVKLHRGSRNFHNEEKKYRLEISAIKQAGSCSFISVKALDGSSNASETLKTTTDSNILKLIIAGSDDVIKDVWAQSFIGSNKPLKFKFEYNCDKKKHELKSFKGEKCIIEKSVVLGSPIITTEGVIGVVGEDADRQPIPYFITQTELGHREKDPSESGIGEDKSNLDDLATEDSAGISGTEHEEKCPCEGGTDEVKPIKDEDGVETPDASGPIGQTTQNYEKLTAPVPVSDQSASEDQERELGEQQNKFVSGREKPPSSTETISALESTEKIRSGKVPLEWFPYLALDMEGNVKWKTFGKSLNLTDADIESIDKDNNEEYERYYKMLKTWWQRGDASHDNLASALRQHGLKGIHDDYCLMEQEPPVKKEVELPKNLKEGPIDDRALQAISHAVKGKRKRLGRALGLKEDRLEDIEEENPKDAPEQSYQILRAWRNAKGKNATYCALAQALYDRTVSLSRVVMDLCLKKHH